jgi:hypothetical protein
MQDISIKGEPLQLLKSFIGKKLNQYQHDPFSVHNAVYQNVGLLIDDSPFLLEAEQVTIPFFSESEEDLSVLMVSPAKKEDLHSVLSNTKQISFPVDETIEDIVLVNDVVEGRQNGKLFYTLTQTKAIIFVLHDHEIGFEKGNWISDFINVLRGSDVIQKLEAPDNGFQMKEAGYSTSATRSVIRLRGTR